MDLDLLSESRCFDNNINQNVDIRRYLQFKLEVLFLDRQDEYT